MSQVKLSVVAQTVGTHGDVIAAAVSSEVKARDKWLVLGKTLYEDGVRVAMLVPDTEKHPNPENDPGLCATIEGFIIAGLSASKRTLKFDSPNPRAAGAAQTGKGPHAWTIGDLLSLTREELRLIDDETLKASRRYWQQYLGAMFSKVRTYVDRFENPDKSRAAKAEKKAEKAQAEAAMPITAEGFLVALRTMNANRGRIGLSARDAENLGDKLSDVIAFLAKATAAPV
jgi:hypothetical protein